MIARRALAQVFVEDRLLHNDRRRRRRACATRSSCGLCTFRTLRVRAAANRTPGDAVRRVLGGNDVSMSPQILASPEYDSWFARLGPAFGLMVRRAPCGFDQNQI